MNRDVKKSIADEKESAQESRQLFMETVRALASAIDEKDFYTRGHSERVTRFSVEIARIMDLSEEDIQKVTIGALIHDFGKLAIDDRILKKPTMLTEEEYEVMKTHTTRGYDMLKHIPQLKEIIMGLQSHHEQLDGKGYPQGLKGDEIPMIARIIMVADCFDAMTTARPYHEPAPVDHVIGVIRSFAGTKYDQRVVEALVEAVETNRIVPSSAN